MNNFEKELKTRIEDEISIIKNDLVETVVKIVTNVDDKFNVFDNKANELDEAIKDLLDHKFKKFDKTSKDEFDALKYVVDDAGVKVSRNLAALKKLEKGFAKVDGNVKEIKDRADILNAEIKEKN